MEGHEIEAAIGIWKAHVAGIYSKDAEGAWRMYLRTADAAVVNAAIVAVADDVQRGKVKQANLHTLQRYVNCMPSVAAGVADLAQEICENCGSRGEVGLVLASDSPTGRPCRHVRASEAAERAGLAREYWSQGWPCPVCQKGRRIAELRGISPERVKAVAEHAVSIPAARAIAEGWQKITDGQDVAALARSGQGQPAPDQGRRPEPAQEVAV
jgi:hypothetical protein